MTVYDAGVSQCRRVFGPVQQEMTGAATLVSTDTGVDVVYNRGGVPLVRSFAGPAPASEQTEAALPASSPPCAVAGKSVFCEDAQGGVLRTRDGVTSLVAHALAGTSLSGAAVGDHTALAYLAHKSTTEGQTSHAWILADDAPAVVLSEGGSGATFVSLAPRGKEIVAFYVDGRTAMSPAHARTVTFKAGSAGGATLGLDAVLFVGGAAEMHTAGALSVSAAGATFALFPVAGESGFGMAAIRIDEPPRDDAFTAWSPYPNGLDPAPVAATVGTPHARVARVRPVDARPEAARGLELGQIDDKGAFTAFGFMGSRGSVRDVAVAEDRSSGGLWVHYTDPAGSWLERRQCP